MLSSWFAPGVLRPHKLVKAAEAVAPVERRKSVERLASKNFRRSMKVPEVSRASPAMVGEDADAGL
jgi:hypothetical protein